MVRPVAAPALRSHSMMEMSESLRWFSQIPILVDRISGPLGWWDALTASFTANTMDVYGSN